MRATTLGALALSATMVWAVGCGKRNVVGDLPPPEGFNEPDRIEPLDNVDYSEYDDANQAGRDDGDDKTGSEDAPTGNPVFRDGMSVNEAMEAARGTERLNIDQDVLGAPLTRPELYEPCKLGPSDHFDLRVAVWQGRAVGIDIDMKNEKTKACIVDQIRRLRWKDKVKSLNTVEYSM